MPNDQYTAPHTLRAGRVAVHFGTKVRRLPIYRPMGGRAWAQDTPQREAACVRCSLSSLNAWERLCDEVGAARPFRGPVLAVVDDLLVLARDEWWETQDPSGEVVGHVERRGRNRHAVIFDDITEALNA